MKKILLLIVLIYSNIVSAQDTIPVKSPEDKHKITEIDSTNKEDKELIEKLNKKYLNQEFYFYMDYTNTFNQIKFVKSKIINIEYNYYKLYLFADDCCIACSVFIEGGFCYLGAIFIFSYNRIEHDWFQTNRSSTC